MSANLPYIILGGVYIVGFVLYLKDRLLWVDLCYTSKVPISIKNRLPEPKDVWLAAVWPIILFIFLFWSLMLIVHNAVAILVLFFGLRYNTTVAFSKINQFLDNRIKILGS